MSNQAIYYHNPRCSKSRQGLELLEKSNFKYSIKHYLKEDLSEAEIESLIKKLATEDIKLLIRTKENTYKELNIDESSMSIQKWAKLIVKNPIILERPLLVTNTQTIIGRPPENFIPVISNT